MATGASADRSLPDRSAGDRRAPARAAPGRSLPGRARRAGRPGALPGRPADDRSGTGLAAARRSDATDASGSGRRRRGDPPYGAAAAAGDSGPGGAADATTGIRGRCAGAEGGAVGIAALVRTPPAAHHVDARGARPRRQRGRDRVLGEPCSRGRDDARSRRPVRRLDRLCRDSRVTAICASASPGSSTPSASRSQELAEQVIANYRGTTPTVRERQWKLAQRNSSRRSGSRRAMPAQGGAPVLRGTSAPDRRGSRKGAPSDGRGQPAVHRMR